VFKLGQNRAGVFGPQRVRGGTRDPQAGNIDDMPYEALLPGAGHGGSEQGEMIVDRAWRALRPRVEEIAAPGLLTDPVPPHWLLPRPRDVAHDVFRADVVGGRFEAEEIDQFPKLIPHRRPRPAMPRVVFGVGGDHLCEGDRSDRRGRRFLDRSYAGAALQQRLDRLRLTLRLYWLSRFRINAVALIALSVALEIVLPALARFVEEYGRDGSSLACAGPV